MDYCDIACRAAKSAGRIHKKYFGSKLKIKNKGSTFDLLTIADTRAEKAAVSSIRKYFPQHNFLAEEKFYEKKNSEYTWIIDPLDGTNNFACGLPIFCVSVALAHKDEVIAAAVYDCLRDELFYARKNKGAFLNGKRIFVSPAASLKRSLLITGFYYSRGREMVETLDSIKDFHYRHVLGIRRLGAAALDLSYVACGRAAGFWEFELSPWDFAAGKLLIEEAGGRVTGKDSEKVPLYEKCFIVASNRKIHRSMLEVIKDNYNV
ncbi:MAG: inositol monophosphatase [Candidatus Omnitrophica bacterium]|nr:inositol monophosphatase [Candidatus Omnitrophota bacterium]